MAYEFLSVRREGAVEYLTLNRPDVRNAFNDQMIAELADWASSLSESARRHEVRAVVLVGAGTVFCAGGDAKWLASTIRCSEAENLRDGQAMAAMFAAIDDLPRDGKGQASYIGAVLETVALTINGLPYGYALMGRGGQ